VYNLFSHKLIIVVHTKLVERVSKFVFTFRDATSNDALENWVTYFVLLCLVLYWRR